MSTKLHILGRGRLAWLSLLLAICITLVSVPATPGLAQGTRDGAPNLSTDLRDLAASAQAGQVVIAAQNSDIRLEGGRVMVTLIMLDATAADRAIAALPRLDSAVTAHYKSWIDAWVPVERLEQVARLPGISLVRTPLWTAPIAEPEPAEAGAATETGEVGLLAGSTQTSGVINSNADVWHRAGYQGQNIRIAVLENGGGLGGFKDYLLAQGSGDLPANIEIYTITEPDPNDPTRQREVPLAMGGNHGTKAAEIVYDLAPGAQLLFASPRTGTELAQFIVDLASTRNIDIFSASLSLSGFSAGDGTGPVAEAIAEAFHSYDALYVQSAGNQAEGHWDGLFTDSNNDGIHEFATGDTLNNVCTSGPVFLRWNDWPASDNDFDFFLIRELANGGTEVVDASMNTQTGTQPPIEYVMPPASGCYGLQVVARDIDRTRSHVLNIWTFDRELEYQVQARSLLETATSVETIGVAAVEGSSHTRMFYSSVGPAHGPGGSLSSGPAQPRIAGFADVATSQGDMGGTSAAAPHVAGATALIMQRFGRDAALVKDILEQRAVDKGATGYDFEYGYGVLQLRSPCDLGDTDEPNDDPTGFNSSGRPAKEATPLEVNDFSRSGWLCPTNDPDWFWFDAVPNSAHVIEALNNAAGTNARLRLELLRKQTGQPVQVLATDEAGRNETASIEYTPTAAGTYLVRITDVNGLGVENYRYSVSVRTRGAPAPLDFSHGFEGVDYLIPAMTARVSGSGRVRVTSEHGPYEGQRHLVLDSATSSLRSAAEVTLYLDTTGYRQLSLSFRQREYNDEANPLSNEYHVSNPNDPNVGMVNGDGVAVSFDGGFSWYRVVDLSGSQSSNSWAPFTIDLDQVARTHGETIGPQLRIRFHHYETGSAVAAPSDGFAFDNITVAGTK